MMICISTDNDQLLKYARSRWKHSSIGDQSIDELI